MSIKYIDEVVCYDDEEDLLRLIEFYKPDVRILGDDYIGKRFTGDYLPIDVIYTTRSHGWSTTRIKDLITIQTINQNPEIIKNTNNND
jgi:glycerol-3-phosphate cytidylyltransferase-like family protein